MNFSSIISSTKRRNKTLGIYVVASLLSLTANTAPPWDLAAWSTTAPSQEDLKGLKDLTESYQKKSYPELYTLAKMEAVFVSHSRSETEWAAWRFAHLYRLTTDRDYAKRSAVLLAGLAARDIPPAPEKIHIEGKWIPYPAVIAYGLIQSSTIWPLQMEEKAHVVEKMFIDHWIRSYAESFRRILERPGQVTNYTPFGLRHAASLALVIKDPHLMTLCQETAWELAFSPKFWHADLIWQEGTVSYARQVSGNLKDMLPMLEAGLEAGWLQDASILKQLGERLERIDKAQINFSMPSGRPIPVHDTHWMIPSDALPRASRAIAYPDFGHFALKGPDLETHLSIPSLTGGGRYGGGHRHDSRLALSLWAHGQELLPDAGYPFYPANHRYFHMSPLAHNLALSVDPKAEFPAGPYGIWGGAWARSNLVGYDDGSSHEGKITYIAATSPGPKEELMKRAERHVLQVETGMWSGYVVDIFWVQGGRYHRSFLRQSEDEAVTQSVDIELSPVGDTMAEILGEPSEGDKAWTRKLLHPLKVLTENGFHIEWAGNESGVTLNIHVAPQSGSVSWLSQMPRLRPTNQDPSKRDDFPGWHLFRQREVQADELTLWAAIYEPVANGAERQIDKVSWSLDPNQKGLKVEIFLGERKDTWVLALNDSENFSIEDVNLKGQAAGFSEQKGQLQWSWAATGSHLSQLNKERANGGSAQPFLVKSLQAEDGGETILQVDGAMELPPGKWANLTFADGSGRGMYLPAIASKEKMTTRFSLERPPGLEVDKEGMRRIAFPQHDIPGRVELTPLGGYFKRYTDELK